MEGRLRLAEKERARRQARTAAAPGGPSSSTQNGPSSQELEQLEAQANANMAALLLEEASTKARALAATLAFAALQFFCAQGWLGVMNSLLVKVHCFGSAL